VCAMAMVASNPVVSYEDVRKQRMEENKQKMEALGLLGLSQSLKPVKKNAATVKGPAGFDAGDANAGGVER
jgi:hypothetical protein